MLCRLPLVLRLLTQCVDRAQGGHHADVGAEEIYRLPARVDVVGKGLGVQDGEVVVLAERVPGELPVATEGMEMVLGVETERIESPVPELRPEPTEQFVDVDRRPRDRATEEHPVLLCRGELDEPMVLTTQLLEAFRFRDTE